jgi:hypothetical protein
VSLSFSRDNEPLIAVGMRPDLVRTALANDLPSSVEERSAHFAVLLRHQW